MKILTLKRKKSNNETPKEQYETCVMCRRVTHTLISTPIAKRNNYIRGVGQLCTDCHRKLVLEKLWLED